MPLLFSLRDLPIKDSFHTGMVAGTVHYLTLIYWLVPTMRTYGGLTMILCVIILLGFSLYLAFYIALFSAAVTAFCRKPITGLVMIPVLWVALEYIRAYLFTGFPWELLGHSQFSRIFLIQIADITGVYGISFLIVFANAVIFFAFLYLKGLDWQGADITKKAVAVSSGVLVFLLALVVLYGYLRVKTVDREISISEKIIISAVQGNIPQSLKWDDEYKSSTINKYIRLSKAEKKDNPELIVWPETATPFYLGYDVAMTSLLKKGIKETGVYCLTGSPAFNQVNKTIQYYNSAYLIDPKGVPVARYDKAHLVPFGEYVPFKKWLPFINKLVVGVGDFGPGIKGKTIFMQEKKLGIQICYEIIFPGLSRAIVKNRAAVIVNITNDAWYGNTSAPYQHFSMTVFRAVENRRALVRAANTGVSGFIDPVGRVVEKTPIFKEAAVTQPLPVLKCMTVYTSYGEVFAGICLVVSLLLFLRKIVIAYGSRKH